jgi:hypothetical protein
MIIEIEITNTYEKKLFVLPIFKSLLTFFLMNPINPSNQKISNQKVEPSGG